MEKTVPTSKLYIRVGNVVPTTEKLINYAKINDKNAFLNQLDIITDADLVDEYMASNSAYTSVDVADYLDLSENVRTMVSDIIVDLDLATGYTNSDSETDEYLAQKTAAVTEKETLFNTEFVKAMKYANLVDATEEEWHQFLIKSFFAPPWNKVFKTDIIKDNNLRFDSECVCFEDLIFNLNYCKHISTFKGISDPLYFYRTIKTINHVSKRKWGKLFNISKKVAVAVNEFIENKNGRDVLKDVRRYTYQAYITELKSRKTAEKSLYNDALTQVLREEEFINSIKSMKNKGKALTLLLLTRKLKLSVLTKKLIDKQV